ncbi:MAG: T9SS type A sorting domain-containing protein [Bacteroidota bacterium]
MISLLYPRIKAIWMLFVFLFSMLTLFGQQPLFRVDSIINFSQQGFSDSLAESKTICQFSTSQNFPGCYAYNSCISYSRSGLGQAWEPSYRIDRKYEEDGQNSSHISFQWHETSAQWVPNSKNVALQEGQTQIKIISIWDTLKNQWIDIDLREKRWTEEDANLVYDESRQYYPDEDRWSGFLSEHEYDEEGRRTRQSNASWNNEEGGWINEYREEYTYRPGGQIASQSFWNWRRDLDIWQRNGTTTYTYDGNDRLDGTIFEGGNGIPLTKQEYEYNSNGRRILWTTYQYDSSQNDWVPERKEEYRYDSSNRESLLEIFRWAIETMSWQKQEWKEWIYSQTPASTIIRGYSWDEDSAIWFQSLDVLTERDPTGRLILRESRDRDHLQESWSGRKQVYEYEVNGDMTIREEARWNADLEDWGYTSRSETILDNQFNLHFSAIYLWDTDQMNWRGQSRLRITYDQHGNRIHEKKYFWDIIGMEWIPGTSQLLSYTDCEEGLTRVEQTGGKIHIYPTPVQDGTLYVENRSEEIGTYEILDRSGRMVRTGELKAIYDQVNVAELNNGLYLIRFWIAEELILKKLLIAQ